MTARGPDATAGVAPASRLGIGALAAAVLAAMAAAQTPAVDGADRGLRDAVRDLADPDLARAATARILARGSAAVPVLQDAYEAWRVGAPTVPLWHLLWVTGRLGPAGAELWPAVATALDASIAARDMAFVQQAAWTLGEIATADQAFDIARHLSAALDGNLRWNVELRIAQEKATLVYDPERPLSWPRLGSSPRIRPAEAAMAWAWLRDGRADPGAIAHLVACWRSHLERGHGRPAPNRVVAEVGIALLRTGAFRDADLDPGELARAAMAHFDPAVRIAAAECLADLAIATPRAAAALVTALGDDQPAARAAAIRGLNAGDPDGSLRTLIAAWAVIGAGGGDRAGDAERQMRGLARRAGGAEAALVAAVCDRNEVDALVARLRSEPGFATAAIARFTAIAREIGWDGWTRFALDAAVAAPERRAELWPAAVDRVAFAGPAELPAVVDAIAALTDGPHGVPAHAVAERLEAAVTARTENLDLAPVVATLARLRIPADASTTELLWIVGDGDPRARVRAIELLAQRGDRSPDVRSVLRAAVDAEHPTRIAIGQHEQHDVAGRIAVQKAAERALAALAR